MDIFEEFIVKGMVHIELAFEMRKIAETLYELGEKTDDKMRKLAYTEAAGVVISTANKILENLDNLLPPED